MPHDLARQLVAAYPDVWAAGMLAYFPHDGRRVRVENGDLWSSTTAVPDLDCPATAGVLLARLHAVNLARGRGSVSVLMFRTFVEVHVGPGETFSGPTVGHACASALVALTTPPTE